MSADPVPLWAAACDGGLRHCRPLDQPRVPLLTFQQFRATGLLWKGLQKRRPGVLLEQIDAAHIAAQRIERLVSRLSASFHTDAPVSAAEVRKPEHSEWPL